MLSSSVFPLGSIPELPPGLYYPADVSNYREIAVAAQNIVNGCVKDALEPPQQCGGWINVGGRDSIGIFIWGTFSMMNRRVGPSVNAVGGEEGTMGNGTVGSTAVLGNGTLEVGGQSTTGLGENETGVESS